MISIEPTYKRIGQNIVPIVTSSTKKVDNYVTSVSKTVTDNSAGNISNFRKRAEQLAKAMNISIDEAIKELQRRGEHLLDILA